MAWFGDGLSSLSNLKGQITSFTKDVLSEGIVEEIDERSKELREANEKCVQLQELLNSKDAEISLLRRQNCELQKAVVELDEKLRQPNESSQDDDGGGYFWDPPSIKNRDSKKHNQTQLLQEELSQATMKIRELEAELLRVQKVNAAGFKEDIIADGHQTTSSVLRAKQDMLNRMIQMVEKNRVAERNMKRLQLDEAALVNDFRMIISQLGSTEQLELIRGALKALESENQKVKLAEEEKEKSDVGEKITKFDEAGFESVSLKTANGIAAHKRDDRFSESVNKRDVDLLKKIAELEESNWALTNSIEELDQQHSESIEKILALKEEIQRKHQSLQKAYEQLYVDYNEVQSKLEKAESKLVSSEANNNTIVKKVVKIQPSQTDNVHTANVYTQTEALAENNVLAEIDVLTKKVGDILKNDSIEVNGDESIFEAAARQYVEAKWKKDMLERKLTEVSRELKQTAEIKESLQMECDDMQTNIESLLLEIQHLKSNLPSIPEASEERVATLETEAESLNEEVKRLQNENSAVRQKNADLILAMHNVEASLRNQENLEAEVRNTKQQLDIAKQQLAGASKNVENNENMMEDLSRRLHVSLDENNELRKKIDQLQISERQVQEQLKMSLEKCKGLDENIELIEELKLDLETVRKELKTSIANGKQLESKLSILQDAKSGIERDLNSMLHEKEQLIAELSVLRQNMSTNEDNDLLASLREQLETANREKDDLEYDILNMRKELDQALSQLEMEQNQVAKLSQDSERLVKENSSLLDQLTVTQDESSDNIELLNTEMVLLEQKHSNLKKEAAAKKDELIKVTDQLHASERKFAELENQLAVLKLQYETLQSDNKRLNELEAKLISLRSKEGQLTVVEEKCKKLETELETLRDADQKLRTTENKCSQLESELLALRTECEKKVSAEEAQAANYEKEQILAVLEEKTRENGSLLAENRRLMSTITAEQQKLQSTIEKNKEATDMARETIESLSQLVREKDIEIHKLNANASSSVTTKPEIEAELMSVKNERDELVTLVQTKYNDSLQYYAEVQRLTQMVNEQVSNTQKLIAEREANSEAMKKKEAELLWAQNELEVVRQRLRNFEASNNYGETCGIVEHSVQVAQAAILNEKCNALEAALLQEQSNNRLLQNQLTESENKESTAGKELERLRTHLMEMEASYTEEALIAERNKEELEAKLVQAEERAKNSSTVYTSASIRANQQVETLQQQMALIVQQRDEIQNKLSAAEDKVLAHTASLTNLQIVLEQFQRDKEKDILSATQKIRQELHYSGTKQEELSREISNLKDQLMEAKECLQAASRLSEELSRKTERIEQLTQEVELLSELVNTADERIQEANKSGEGKVDRTLVKNLLLGYLSSSATDKSSVLRVFAIVLDFNESERDKAGLNNPAANSGWFSGLLGSGGATPSKDQEASLSAAFVRFLESESKPKPQLPALPLSTTPPPRPGHSRQHSSSSTQSTLLLSNISLPTFPDFVPARNTGSILKEVLKDS